MKKTIVNFQNPLYTVLFFALFCLTSCQKENIRPIFNKEKVEIHELDLSNLAMQMKSNARNDAWVVMNEVVHVTYEGPYLISINVENIPDPSTHRLDVTIIPFDKPTDLVLQSFDPDRNPTNLDLKESRNPGMQTDFVKFRRNDFVIGETNAMLKMEWEGQGNKFEVKINAVRVDCQEEQPRNQGDVGIEFQPVCGCDGRTYFDQTAAYNAGITSWERGQCTPDLNIPIEGVWKITDIGFPIRQLEIVEYIAKNCYVLTITWIDSEGNDSYTSRSIICPEEEAEGRTWTVVDEKPKGGPLFWPVEKWSAQVNDQGELEIYRSNGAKNKDDKKDNTTIFHQFKRIK